ncbi:MAG: PilZ domain-containing protein [Proteobacteria bacterium]|nr:PilZ domain-containing protein [Pseudomonadota bacterium]
MNKEAKEKRISSRGALQVSARCRLKNRLNNASEEIVVVGTVARSMPFNRGAQDINHTLGIRFSDLTEKQKKAIVNFIHQYLVDMRQDQAVS